MSTETRPADAETAGRSIGGPLISLVDRIPEGRRADAGRILSRLNERPEAYGPAAELVEALAEGHEFLAGMMAERLLWALAAGGGR